MLNKLFDRILYGSAWFVAGVLVYITLTIVYEVVMRYAFGRPTTWVIDFIEYGIIYITFLGAGWVAAKERHIKIDILLSALPYRSQRLLNIITSVLAAAACGVFFWYSLQLTWQAFAKSEMLWHSTIVPKGIIWIAAPIGSLLLTLQFLRRAWSHFRKRKLTDAIGS